MSSHAPAVILVRTRFPENIGMAARACANMGVSELILVDPEWWDLEKALPLATGQGRRILESVQIMSSLPEALAPFDRVFGTTARTGGWRRNICDEREAGERMAAFEREGARLALVFGPEDRGLENPEIERCTDLVTIRTPAAASSLNLAQAVLLLLHERYAASGAMLPLSSPKGKGRSRKATAAEQETLFATMRESLLRLDVIRQDNPDWFMLPLRSFFHRAVLERHEFDLFMGICRQINRLADTARADDKAAP